LALELEFALESPLVLSWASAWLWLMEKR
jgi:hypothetical protein